MLIVCPSCDSFVPMDIEISKSQSGKDVTCPNCAQSFDTTKDYTDVIEEQVEQLKDHLVIQNSLQNNARLFDDC